MGVLVSHMPVQVELFELSKSAEAKETENLLSQVVAQISVGPHLLVRSAILYSRGWWGVISNVPIVIIWRQIKFISQMYSTTREY